MNDIRPIDGNGHVPDETVCSCCIREALETLIEAASTNVAQLAQIIGEVMAGDHDA